MILSDLLTKLGSNSFNIHFSVEAKNDQSNLDCAIYSTVMKC